jgi:hypothetical protein
MTQEDGVGDYAQRLADIATKDTDDELAGPYKGLLTYRLSDAALFFGRDQAIADLWIVIGGALVLTAIFVMELVWVYLS